MSGTYGRWRLSLRSPSRWARQWRDRERSAAGGGTVTPQASLDPRGNDSDPCGSAFAITAVMVGNFIDTARNGPSTALRRRQARS
jgi:hypothetical protein